LTHYSNKLKINEGTAMIQDQVKDQVKEYYGKELTGSEDLKTNACCTDASLPSHIKTALANVHDEVLSRYYGCGLIAPEHLTGCRILDLGSGSGRDAYVLSQIVGEQGEIVGVDMTPEQLDVAREYEEWHRERFGYAKSNVTFIEGELEKLDQLELEPHSFDVIVSNCVINLCSDKEAVMTAAKNLLKPGGEIYFSDVYSDRRVPQVLLEDPVLYGECLSGALYINDFESLVRKIGFTDPRITESRRLTIDNEEIEKLVGDIRFYSVTYRLFNIDGLEPNCEDYGQSVKYSGTVTTSPNNFILDNHHTINRGEIFPVCGNTYKMLNESRFASHFEFRGDFENHYGIFAGCGDLLSATECCSDDDSIGGSCCSTPAISESSCCEPSSGDASGDESCCAPTVSSVMGLVGKDIEVSPPGNVNTTSIKELWFHTGTTCNLSCDGCLEGSHPGSTRIEHLTFDDAVRYIDEALLLGVEQFSFTGGEPFINKEMVAILDYALQFKPCLVLTNGTKPLQHKIEELITLQDSKHNLTFRVSLDHYDEARHDAIRGDGNFTLALKGIELLDNAGFDVSIARHEDRNEDSAVVESKYGDLFEANGLSKERVFISFPDLLSPDSHPDGLPTITENCLKKFDGTTGFMCESSRMIVKKNGHCSVYACTLVDDDDSYSLGTTIMETVETPIHLTHHRCFACFNSGASCSEL